MKTSNLSFNRNTGEASTPAPVEFQFPSGQGRGVGVSYSTSDSIVRIEHDVEFELAASDQTGGMPVTATGSSLEIRRADRTVVLKGPATVQEGARELSADTFSVELDVDNHARRAVAEGHPQIHAAPKAERTSPFWLRVSRPSLNPAGWVEHVVADGNIVGHSPDGRRHRPIFRRARRIRDGAAKKPDSGHDRNRGVTAESHQGDDSRVLKTEALRVTFSTRLRASARPGEHREAKLTSRELKAPKHWRPPPSNRTDAAPTPPRCARRNSSRSWGPAATSTNCSGTPASKSTGRSVTPRRRCFQPRNWSPRSARTAIGTRSTSAATSASSKADRRASADHANIVRATDTITLDGSPVISDAMSRTTAANVTRQSEIGRAARHRRRGFYLHCRPRKGDTLSLGSGTAHISADSLSGTVGSNHVVVTYTGHARLWQGESVLESDQIEVWQDDKKLQATGHVVAVFSQVAGSFRRHARTGQPAPNRAPHREALAGSSAGPDALEGDRAHA